MSSIFALRLSVTAFVAVFVSPFLPFSRAAEPAPVTPSPPEEVRAHVLELRAEIARHDELYFRRAEPEISDHAYDLLKSELARLEAVYPAVLPEPAGTLGDDRTGLFPVIRHHQRMLSLDKTHDEADLCAFHARLGKKIGRADFACIVEPKVDGLAVNVTYRHGHLVHAVTRGNGEAGDDITANVLTIGALPRELRTSSTESKATKIPDLVELHGEVYLSFAEFDRINREQAEAGEPLFANPRNLAAGTVRLLDSREVARRKLGIVFHGWGACEPAGFESQDGFYACARAWGLPVLENCRIVHSADEMWHAVQELAAAQPGLAFPIDGAVIKLNEASGRERFGATEHAPRWAMAFKYDPARIETQLTGITFQVGRSGVLTPVAELTPVSLAGGIVSRATLHNCKEIGRLDLRVGDFVYVEKAGEIVPAITGVNLVRRAPAAPPFVPPAVCPSCGSAIIVENAVTLRCPNPGCPAQVCRRIRHFASPAGVNIPGLGPDLIATLVERGRVKDVPDLYRLRREDLLGLGRNMEKSADNLLAAIERSKRAELHRFICGLGIPQVGPVAARDLATEVGSLEAMVAAEVPAGQSDPELTPAKRALLEYLREPQHRALLRELVALGVKPVDKAAGS